MNTLLISVPQVLARLARGTRVVFVDCRSAESWERAGIKLPGAVRAQADSLSDTANRIDSQSAVTVAYGEHGWEQTSVELVHNLHALGADDAWVLAGGLSAWVARGLPTETTATAAPVN